MASKEMNLRVVDAESVATKVYDLVIVGSGVVGAILAEQISNRGKSVLIIEAGTSEGLSAAGFQGYVDTFYTAVTKHGNSPYPENPNALSPTDDRNGYFQEQGPLPISGSYTRVLGGTTMHWEGKALRMLPDDFELRRKYGVGLDWPVGYHELEPYYRKAEYEVGVSGDIEEQKDIGIPFPPGYDFPMKRIPPSYLDEVVRDGIKGLVAKIGSLKIPLRLSTFPQARNGSPAGSFSPDGAQCGGNASCVPICPYQAKYDARRTLAKIKSGVDLLPQSVAYKVTLDPASGIVKEIEFKTYLDRSSPHYTVGRAHGRVFALAGNAIENARLMLASGLSSTSGLMGKNLMDHPFLLTWGLMPKPVGTMRGPLVTSGVASFRNGPFRNDQAAFAVDIHNDGWGWSGTGAGDILQDTVEREGRFGSSLRQELVTRISRQILLAFMCEMPADSNNRVTVDPQYIDPLGNYRPVIHFDLPEYCKKSLAYSRSLSRTIFNKLGVEDHTAYLREDPAYFEYGGTGYWFRGGNHFSGTHVMGSSKASSVVDRQLRSWDHRNLFLIGGGSMPSIGAANITLTIAALTFRASDQIAADLRH